MDPLQCPQGAAERSRTPHPPAGRGGEIGPSPLADVLDLSDIPACAFWPVQHAGARRWRRRPCRAVPTLILSGADDLRTPTANAREVAALIPGAKLLVVPNTGHSVLDSDTTSCSSARCRRCSRPSRSNPAKPSRPRCSRPRRPCRRPASPTSPPARGNRGRAGRTLAAVLLTLADLDRQLAEQALAQLASNGLTSASSVDVGGLRSGWAQFTVGRLLLHGYSYVPGVAISGSDHGREREAERRRCGRGTRPGAPRAAQDADRAARR